MSNLYRFEPFVLDPGRRTLSHADSPVSLTPKAFDVLLFLVQNPNRLVTKEELLQAVWGDTFVGEGNLKQYVSHLRKALGDNSEDTRLIVTIARKGYQFTARVTVAEAADTAQQAAVQVSTADGSLAALQPGVRSPVHRALPKRGKALVESSGRECVRRPLGGLVFCVLAPRCGHDATKVAKNHAGRAAV
jgi:DNA-binding winged helix-turn-helix (wHTH) protein